MDFDSYILDELRAVRDELGGARQDIGFIKERVEDIPNHDTRIKSLEKLRDRIKYGIPGGALLGAFAYFGIPLK